MHPYRHPEQSQHSSRSQHQLQLQHAYPGCCAYRLVLGTDCWSDCQQAILSGWANRYVGVVQQHVQQQAFPIQFINKDCMSLGPNITFPVKLLDNCLTPMNHQSLSFESFEKKGPHDALEIRLNEKVDQEEFMKHVISILQAQSGAKPEYSLKSIWVYLNEHNLSLVEPLVKAGFKIHHGLDNQLAVYKWLDNWYDMVPPYSMVYVGCGGLIIDNQCVLLVQEKSGTRKNEWGIPGGLMNRGEAINIAAEREVFEQTGYKTNYQYITYLRELNNSLHGGVDLYFVCYMKLAEGVTRENGTMCVREIQDHKWVPLAQLEMFVATNTFNGTQKVLIPYIFQLYKQGFDFDKGATNTTQELMISSRGSLKRFTQHKFVL